MIELDFLRQQRPKNITSKNIHNVLFVHSNKKNNLETFNLSPDNVHHDVHNFDGIPVSWGKMSGDVMWASPYAFEFISKDKYSLNKSKFEYACFYKTRKYRKWENYNRDGIPIVAASDWDAYTQLENQEFTANRFVFFTLDKNAKILIINTFAAYKKAMETFGYDEVCVGHPGDITTYFETAHVLKFENIAKYYDGMYVSANLKNTKQTISEEEQKVILKALSIWDVDSLVLWKDVIRTPIHMDAAQARDFIKKYYLGNHQKAFTSGIKYEVVLESDEMIVRKNNYESFKQGLLLGVKNCKKHGLTIFYQSGNDCYEAKLSPEQICTTTYLGHIAKVWSQIQNKSNNIIICKNKLALEISHHSTICFKSKEQTINYPAIVFWVNQKIFAAFYVDEQLKVHHLDFTTQFLN